jgi:O-antigen ligase
MTDRLDRPLAHRALEVVLFVLGAAVWWSPALSNIAFVAVLAVAAFTGRAPDWRRAFSHPVAVAGLALLAYIVVRSVPQGAAGVLYGARGYFELAMVPLLLVALASVASCRALWAGLCAGCIGYGLVHWAGLFNDALGIYLSGKRISAGFNMALFAYVAFDLADRRAHGGRAYALSAFAAATVLFAIGSRTGHLVLLALLLLTAYQAAPRRLRFIALLFALGAFVLLAALSNPVRTRLAETVGASTETRSPVTSSSNSSEIRLAIIRHSLTVASDHFAIGTGWTRYAEAFGEAIRAGGDQVDVFSLGNPHNEYLLQLGAGGIPALVLFLAWLAAPAVGRRAGRWAWNDPRLRAGALAFAIGCLFNSLLLDFLEAHFYVTVLAWMLADGFRRDAAAAEVPAG